MTPLYLQKRSSSVSVFSLFPSAPTVSLIPLRCCVLQQFRLNASIYIESVPENAIQYKFMVISVDDSKQQNYRRKVQTIHRHYNNNSLNRIIVSELYYLKCSHNNIRVSFETKKKKTGI